MNDCYLLKMFRDLYNKLTTNYWFTNHKTEYLKLISRYILNIYLAQFSRDLK